MDNDSSPIIGKEAALTIRGEKVLVRDPALRRILKTASAFRPILKKFEGNTFEGDALSEIATLLEDDGIFEAFKLCASACTDRDAEFFNDIGLAETLSLVNALQEVVDWTQLKKLLFQLADQGKTQPTPAT